MDCDFSGWATKADVKCSDGRTIMPNAFQHQDTMQVPLVWQHGHNDPENVLGHAILENRDEGVYAYCFFNGTDKAKHAAQLVEHKDIKQMSIWANQLMERSKRVLHGAIREVSLVLSGANPGALIDNITIRHSDDDDEILDDEAVITTGLDIIHSSEGNKMNSNSDLETAVSLEVERQIQILNNNESVQHSLHGTVDPDDDESEMTVEDVYNSMNDDQKNVLHYMVGVAVEEAKGDKNDEEDGPTSVESNKSATSMAQSDIDFQNNDNSTEGSTEMLHNVFETDSAQGTGPEVSISHDEMKNIIQNAKLQHGGSLKAAVEAFASTCDQLQHGIEDIDLLFPDHANVTNAPELFGRRTEWVTKVMSGIRKSPFSKIRTRSADITVAEARAKGYITGTLKKEEFFKLTKRETSPTTIYKKQKLERDDMVDITDFDVVSWLKAEMRIMLEEELARAILVGDGRVSSDDDKINEDCIRPIATDNEVYTTQVYVDIDDASSNMSEVSDALALNRSKLRGTGLPTFFTTETFLAKFLTQRDSLGRRLYMSVESVATELRVESIVTVEVLEEYPLIVGILVNLNDYQVGATAGGEVSLFDDFDIDYNQYKYLMETRCSGALTKLKSAMVINKTVGDATLVVPASPAFSGTAVTITNQTGVVYRNADTDAVINAAGSPYAVASGATLNVHATPSSTSYYFSDSDVDDWSFENEA